MASLSGRDRELRVLERLLDEPTGRAVLLRGDPGIGKSALLDVARELAEERGQLLLDTVGVEAEAQIPFAGLHQLLFPVLDVVDALRGRHRDALRTSFGLTDGPRPEPFLIAESVLALLVRAAADRPVAVVADDLQWLDDQSRGVLDFVARRLGGAPVTVIGAVRAGHPGTYLPGARTVELAGIDDAAADDLLAGHAPELTPGERQRVRREALGNPLALLELPGAWGGRGARGPDGELPTLSQRLERAFVARLVDLPRPTRDAVLVAALDYSDDAGEISRAAARLGDACPTAPLFAPAEQAGLLTVTEGRLAFRHPLVRSGVLQAETLGRRQCAHAALAEVLADEPYRRTWHRAQSIVGPDDEIADALVRSADLSLARGAVLSAIAALERAAQLTVDSTRRGHRLLLAARHAFDLGRVDLLDQLLDAARQTELTELDTARLQWLREISSDGTPGDAARVIELCDIARRSAHANDPDLALDLLLGAAMRCWWADTGAVARARVVTVLRELDVAPDARYAAVLAVAEPVVEAAPVDALLDHFDPADPDAEPADLRLLGMAAHAIGDSPRAKRFLDRAETELREQGRLGLLAHVLSMQVIIRLELGDLHGAQAAVEEGLRVAEDTGQPIWSTGTLVCAARAEAVAGRYDRGLELATRAELAANRQRLNDLLACVQMARGLALLGTGRPELAYAAFRALFDPAAPSFHQRERFDGIMYLAEAAVATGRVAEAREIVEDLEAVALITPSPLLHAQLRFARPVLADPERAEELFLAALADDLHAWPWVRARLEQAFAGWLAAQGRTREAGSLLGSALATFRDTGATPWAATAERQLAALGIRS